MDATPSTEICTVFLRDAHLPYDIFKNPVSSACHMVPGPHFENVSCET